MSNFGTANSMRWFLRLSGIPILRYSVLQHLATFCNILQQFSILVDWGFRASCNGVLHVLQNFGSGLQRCRGEKSLKKLDFDFLSNFGTANSMRWFLRLSGIPILRYSVLQHLATFCNILQQFSILVDWGFRAS